MMRIVLNSGESHDSAYWHEGAPFTGIGFLLGERRTVEAYEVEDGRIIRPYLSPCEIGAEVALRIDLEGATGDQERVMYEGKPFTGMGYEFDEKSCFYEGLFEDGEDVSEIWWSRDGAMSRCHLTHAEFSEFCDFYDDGASKTHEIRNAASLTASITLLPNGQLAALWLDRGTLDMLPAFTARATCFPVRNKADLSKLKAARELRLIGDGIDDNVIAFLGNSGVLASVESLEFFHTALTRVSPQMIGSMPRLREVKVGDDHSLPQAGIARTVKANWPNLIVRLNGATV